MLSLDGLEDYGTSIDDISLLTVNEYRKYRKILGSNLDNWWWLITPDSTPSGCSARDVQSAPMAAWAAAAASLTEACVRFLSFNLRSLKLAEV